jgi:micrococcal nuclease
MRLNSQSQELDPDGDGIACEHLQDVPGFAPAYWTDQLPPGVVSAVLSDVIDGDTLIGQVNGTPETLELYRAWAPDIDECGGQEAKDATKRLLGDNSNGTTVYIEQSDRTRFDNGELLAYVWLKVDGRLFMLNEAIIRSGWAADYEPGDSRYAQQMIEAAEFAARHGLGNWLNCPDGPRPGQTPTPTKPPAETPEPTEAPAACEPSYPTLCIEPGIPDLDCWQIDEKSFPVLPPDPHLFDMDEDGIGCEPYSIHDE